MTHWYSLNNLKVFWQLLIRNMVIFIPQYKDKLINTLIWHTLSVSIFAYIMPHLGLANFGAFILITNIASAGFFNTTENVAIIVSDLEGDKAISYYLTLPIPQWMVFAQMAVASAIQALSIAIVLLPVGLLVLGNIHALPHFCWWKFAIILVISNLFYGFFSLIIAAFTRNIHTMNNAWLRVVFPLWYLGGSNFPWIKMKTVFPGFAHFLLANPLTHILEGTRAATLEPSLSLPFWMCTSILIAFTFLIAYIGITQFMKRLDCLR
jgi:ABC-type polysaccharide/polyol phosphate export permease